MNDKQARRKMRWWVPAAVALLVLATILYFHFTQNVSRHFATAALVVVGLALVSLWYIFLTQLPWKQRMRLFCVWVTGVVFLGVFLAFATRWEGSLTGGALPRLVWKWASERDRSLAPLEGSGGDATLKDQTTAFPGFLGPDRNGVLPGLQLDPDWEANPPEELWRREIGAGWSGFSVANGRAITMEQRGADELVSCYDLATGEPLWVHANQTRFEEAMGGDGPRSNPTIHEGRVYALGATGILMCFDESSGELIWERNILDDPKAQNLQYGKATSPLVAGELVVVTGGQSPGPTLLAFDRLTGEPVWTAGKDSASYASPILTTLGGKEQIVAVNQNTVTAHDPESGETLWSWDWPARMPKSALAQPVGDDQIFVSASYGMGSALLEVMRGPEGFKVTPAWRNREMKTKFSNVCIKDGYAYGLDEGRLACIDLATGKRMWRGDNYGYGQNLLVGGHLLVQSERGYVVLVEATPDEFREVAKLDALDDKTWNNPALAGEYLLVRNDREAVCYKVPLR